MTFIVNLYEDEKDVFNLYQIINKFYFDIGIILATYYFILIVRIFDSKGFSFWQKYVNNGKSKDNQI